MHSHRAVALTFPSPMNTRKQAFRAGSATREAVGSRPHGSALGHLNLRWRLAGPLLALTVVLAAGTVGYMLIEGWTWDEALYMVVTTVSTVGFGEVHPLSRTGRWFTIVVILIGVGSLFYGFGAILSYVFEGHLGRHLESRRMESRVQSVSNHFVLCGYGRVGRQVAKELLREGIAFVVIDVNQESLADAVADGYMVVHGNAADDGVLRAAGIERARGLIAAVAEDADNIFVALSAHAICPHLPIVARANQLDAVRKLQLAGASRVVSPYTMAGQQMALLAVRPTAVDFVETLLRGVGGDLLLEDIMVEPGSLLVGAVVADLRLQSLGMAGIVALKRDGRILAPLPDDLSLSAGDILAVVGTDVQLRSVEALCVRGATSEGRQG